MLRRLLLRIRRELLGDALLQLPGQLPHDLAVLRRDLNVLQLNAKNLGYRIAQELTPGLRAIDRSSEPQQHRLASKPATQSDVESSWFAHWCSELKIAPAYHRKIWEYAYVLQTLFDHGKLEPGLSGLGFGCGEEPVASFLASRGIRVTVTDLDPVKARGKGWIETGQHISSLEQAFRSELVSRDQFDRLVRLEYVDMNQIPPHLDGRHDFCWSICALEHLGSIERGMRFAEKAMATLRPGGMAVHTTEFNYLSVLFLKKHFTELRTRLERAGYLVRDLDFDTGKGVLDRFIDVPPHFWDGLYRDIWGERGTEAGHLKISVYGFPCTCFGLVIENPPK
jgi:2-polyprenyl-3-methyl-5-hydroxy-6-metoxy-1,4-benzoquinol methylase